MRFPLRILPQQRTLVVCKRNISLASRRYAEKDANPETNNAETPRPPANKLNYATAAKAKADLYNQRLQSADGGVRPSEFQKFFLVLTGLYKRRSDVPDVVSGHVIQKLGDRQRVVFIVAGVIFFFVLFYGLETKVNKAIRKESGTKVQ